MLVGDTAPVPRFDVAIIPMDDAALGQANQIARLLREQWNNVEIFSTGKFKKRLSRANDGGALLAVIIGEEELAAGEVTVKDLHGGEQMRMGLEALADAVSQAQNAHWLRETAARGTEFDPDA